MMDTALPHWHKKILAQIDPRLAKTFIADDPDYLLAEENLQQALLAKGFELHFYEDSIALRYFIEHKVRALGGCSVISVDSDQHSIEAIPFDILQASGRLSLSLGDCFPQLSYSVLQSLQPEELNSLDEALQEYTPGRLNASASSDFVLRHVFKLAPEIIQTSSDLLRALLRLHYRDIELPSILKDRLIALLQKRKQFTHWPLGDIVADKRCFFAFLQRHWVSYVDGVLCSLDQGIQEPKVIYQVNQGSEDSILLPFGHDDVRVYIDNLFLEGYLTPIDIAEPDKLTGHWCLVGILQDPEKELKKRLTGLLNLCDETLPEQGDRHQQWQKYAYRWAELSALYHTNKGNALAEQYAALQQRVDAHFSSWLLEKYAGLHNHPPMPPVMLHHVPRAMARELDANSAAKTAVILIDGLAIDQWVTLKTQWALDTQMHESAVFAWVPSVTSVSRQALFSGKAPYQFASSIQTTSGELKAWRQFWQDHGLDKNAVYYEKSLGNDDVNALIDRLSDRRFKAVGLVINAVDDMMHGMLLGAAGMHKMVSLWAEGGYLKKLVDALLGYGFSIHITSDHGNVEAIGSGKINEGAIAETRGERARVYETQTLRDSLSFDGNEAISWPPTGLPNNYWPVVMKGRKAFVAEGENIVGHGGISIEEILVPYVTIKRKVNE